MSQFKRLKVQIQITFGHFDYLGFNKWWDIVYDGTLKIIYVMVILPGNN